MSETIHTMDDKAYRGLQELLKDAESCARLSDWEEHFLSDLRGKVLVSGQHTRVTDKMWTILQHIEAKVYAT